MAVSLIQYLSKHENLTVGKIYILVRNNVKKNMTVFLLLLLFLCFYLALFFCWSIVDLQYCTKLCCIAKWLSYIQTHIHKHTHTHTQTHTHTHTRTHAYTHTCIYIFFFNILFYYHLSQNITYSSLCYTLRLCCLSIIKVIVCVYQPKLQSTTVILLPCWPQVCSLMPMSHVLFCRWVHLCHILDYI